MASKEFWHESLTEESWKKLQELSKETDLTVIGGWGVWLWTKQHKSRDINIISDFRGLAGLKEKYPLVKNDRLKKYEIPPLALFAEREYPPQAGEKSPSAI